MTALFLTSLLAATCVAQNQPPLAQAADQNPAWGAWQQDHGPWIIRRDSISQMPEFLFGGRIAASSPPTSDQDAYALGIRYLELASELLEVDADQLVAQKLAYLSLQGIGASDKISATYTRHIGGLRVAREHVTVLMSSAGDLLAIHSTCSRRTALNSLAPLVAHGHARRLAQQHVTDELGLHPVTDFTEQPLLLPVNEFRHGGLLPMWVFRIVGTNSSGLREISTAYVPVYSDHLQHLRARRHTRSCSANSSLSPLSNEISGTAEYLATQGVLPDEDSIPAGGNPHGSMSAEDMILQSTSLGTTEVSETGQFKFLGSSQSETVYLRLRSDEVQVFDDAGSPLVESYVVYQNTPGQLFLNPQPGEQATSQVNAYHSLHAILDWVGDIDPAARDDLEENPATQVPITLGPRVNMDDLYLRGNAEYAGLSNGIVEFRFGESGTIGSIPYANMAYSTVVAHEFGHWANEVFGTGDWGDGLGESVADTWATYVYDTEYVAQNVSRPGTFVREAGNGNQRQLCPDENWDCYGTPHENGLPLMGALWKVRENLIQAYPSSNTGEQIADTLFIAWQTAFDQDVLKPVIRDQWLCLDDSNSPGGNGNIFDGTPHFAQINPAFEQHGWPDFFSYDLYALDHVPLPDTNQDGVPYTVSITVTPSRYPTLPQSVTLEHIAGQSQVQEVVMSHLGNGNYQGAIPAVTSPEVVRYRFEVVAQGPFVQYLPSKSEVDSYFQFYVGETQPLYFNDFEGSGDHGWTHGFVQLEDDWERGEPGGKTGFSLGAAWRDPSSAVSGRKVWGNDLGLPGYNGAYSSTVENYLDSPVIDAQGHNGLRLRVWTWLSAAENFTTAGDQLSILILPVNGLPPAVIFENVNSDLGGGPWRVREYDIGQADGSEFQIRFKTNTDLTKDFGGWSIDDFEILTLKASSGGPQSALLRGNTAVSVGDVQVYEISSAPANTAFEIRVAASPGGQYSQIAVTGTTTDANGNATASLPPAPSQYAGATRYFKAFFQTVPVQSSNYCPLEVFP